MSIILKFKTLIGGQKCEVSCNLDDTLEKYITIIKEKIGIEDDFEIKFIQSGKNIELTTPIINISKNIPIGIVKKKKENIIEEQFYSTEQIHKMLPFFIIYLKLNEPVIFSLLATTDDNNTFSSLLLEPKYKVLTDILMKQSSDVVKLINNGITNIKIELPDPDSLEKIALENQNFVLNNKSYDETGASFNSSKENVNKFTETDIKKILLIKSFGIPYEFAKELYMQNNKDINSVIKFLETQQNSSINNE